MSSPIPIPSSSRSRSTYVDIISGPSVGALSLSPSDSDSSSKLYVPIHRRSRNASPAPSTSSSTTSNGFPASPTRSVSSFSSTWSQSDDRLHEFKPSPPGVYSREDLLLLASSHLAWMGPETKAMLRDVAPTIVLTRRKVDTVQWKARREEHQAVQSSRSARARSWGSGSNGQRW